MDFADTLAHLIKGQEWSQNEAGPKLGVTGPFINQIIQGKRRPPLDQLDKWASIFGLSADEKRIFKMKAGLEHIKDATVRKIVTDEMESLSLEVAALGVRLLRAQKQLDDHRNR
jgi:transcriptional regulator with XRE-family HTH domain